MATRPPVIFVDVDDTLIRSFGSKRILMAETIAAVRRLFDGGAVLYCWSSGGAVYAEKSAVECGIADCFTAFLPKPEVLIDDVLLADWRRLVELYPSAAARLTAESVAERLDEVGF